MLDGHDTGDHSGSEDDNERDGHSRVVNGTERLAPIIHPAVKDKFGSWRKLVEKMKPVKSSRYKHGMERLAGILDALDDDPEISIRSDVFERTVRSFVAVQSMSNGNHLQLHEKDRDRYDAASRKQTTYEHRHPEKE